MFQCIATPAIQGTGKYIIRKCIKHNNYYYECPRQNPPDQSSSYSQEHSIQPQSAVAQEGNEPTVQENAIQPQSAAVAQENAQGGWSSQRQKRRCGGDYCGCKKPKCQPCLNPKWKNKRARSTCLQNLHNINVRTSLWLVRNVIIHYTWVHTSIIVIMIFFSQFHMHSIHKLSWYHLSWEWFVHYYIISSSTSDSNLSSKSSSCIENNPALLHYWKCLHF